MCGEMRAFFGVASTIVSVLRGLDADADALQTQFNSSQLSVAAAQLQSFAVSAIGFRKVSSEAFIRTETQTPQALGCTAVCKLESGRLPY